MCDSASIKGINEVTSDALNRCGAAGVSVFITRLSYLGGCKVIHERGLECDMNY